MTFRVGLTLALTCWAIAACIACGAALTSPYAAQQIACVSEAGTRAEANACRCAVKAQYGNPCDDSGVP